MSDCRKCAEFNWCLENEDCGLFKQKSQTNADRIRVMTDEEIEDWYWWMHKEMMYYTDSHAFVHEWLEQGVDDETD